MADGGIADGGTADGGISVSSATVTEGRGPLLRRSADKPQPPAEPQQAGSVEDFSQPLSGDAESASGSVDSATDDAEPAPGAVESAVNDANPASGSV
ncbi:hypothetical protein Aca07nite_79120 [Actinoplanes capillaceus]|uniref:Uncharacterized protein n=1 Tax=Actinoplanes campanulatus TaxID=113559 RepID=A0ABQ3WWG7_9ACTN|nr:hypothetical protein Aca07nite_79120 [Actinoplanes capillaceus]